MGKPIGDLQGVWCLIFKFGVATYPAVLGWACWVTVQLFHLIGFQQHGSRFTFEDGVQLYKEFDGRLDALKAEIHQFESSFTSEFVRKNELPARLER